MTEELKSHLLKLMSTIDGLHAIVVTDRDGVLMLKVANENAPELALRPAFLCAFGLMTEQAGKMGMSQNKSIVSMYSSYQVVQLNKPPLLVSMIADADANTGDILHLENELKDVLTDVAKVIQMS
ncbi:ragulator complex protein LAMTOR3-A-like [Gigantopelta aegis]|uniref:ragulator complex protein LAMTOR3-A-like n=1 Tax=Gigantopelta aegis TaxID=1735272 RepID=UPI001B888297|nr:ragulator complex protein LAMTOR3-A-like [Gigantopelta aegis]